MTEKLLSLGLSIPHPMAKPAPQARFRASGKLGRIVGIGHRGQKMADQEMKAAEQTYHSFLALTKWGIILSAAVTVLVVILIA